MRTLDPALENALDSGTYLPFFEVSIYHPFHPAQDVQPVYFRLDDTTMQVRYPKTTTDLFEDVEPQEIQIILTRGVTAQDTNYIIWTSSFYVTSGSWDGYYQTVQAALLPDRPFETPGDVTYRQVIEAVCAEYDKTAVFKNPSAAWLDYQFLADEKTLKLKKASQFFTLLRQKYLIAVCDNGNDEILFGEVALNPGPAAYSAPCTRASISTAWIERKFVWRTETGAYGFGGGDGRIWNLGFLPSGSQIPSLWHSNPLWSFRALTPHLKYQTLDVINAQADPGISVDFVARVIETFDPSKSPAWFIELQNFNWAEVATEGGDVPTNVEEAAPYMPLDTSSFENILSSDTNNVQTAMEELDDHDHYIEPAIDPDHFLISRFVAGPNRHFWRRSEPGEAYNLLKALLQAGDVAATPGGSLASNTVQGQLAELGAHKEPANSNIQSHISAAAPHSGHSLIDHTHEGSGVAAPTADNDFLLGAYIAGAWTWVVNSLAQTITVLRTSLDAIYEPKNTNIQIHIAAAAPHSGHALNSHLHTSVYAVASHTHPNPSTPVIMFPNSTVAAGTTTRAIPTLDSFTSTGQLNWPIPGKMKNLKVVTNNSQPGGGSLVTTLMVGGSPTALSLTIPAGAAGGTYANSTAEVSVAGGLRFDVSNNAAGAVSANIVQITCEFIPD